MHPVALFADSTCGYEVRTKRVVLWQICSEVHLLPFESLAKFFLPWEAKLSQMPTFDEVYLTILRLFIDLIRMDPNSSLYRLRVSDAVCLIMPKQECILLS